MVRVPPDALKVSRTRPLKLVYITPDYPNGHSWEGLWAGYLHANIEHHPEDDATYFNLFYDRFHDATRAAVAADIVAVTATSPQYNRALRVMEDARHEGSKAAYVLGGPHASALPAQCFKDGWDYVVQGEGEGTFAQIIKRERRGDKITLDRVEPLNVDKLNYPDRHLIKQERHIQQAYSDEGRRVMSMFSGRGCPFHCDFCISHTIWGRAVRLRTPGNILGEMQQLIADWHPDFLKWSDDTFTLDKVRLRGLFKMMKGAGVDLKWGCNLHANTVDRALLEDMHRAGCTEIWVGVESGSPKVLQAMGKHSKVEKLVDVFRDAKEIGMMRRAYIILGHPSETREDVAMTDKLLDTIQPDVVGFTILCPYPGSAHYDPAKHANVDWSKTDEYGNGLWSTPAFSNDDLLAVQQWFVEKWEGHLTYKHAVMGFGVRK